MLQKSKKIVFSAKNTRLLLATGLMSLTLLMAVFIATSSILAVNNQAGQLNPGETHSGENLRSSLDLRVAAKASYPSSSLKVVQDLGTTAGITHQVVSFEVQADGLTEYAMLAKPAAAAPAGGYPVIILCHGYINPAEYTTDLGYIGDMDSYAKNGFLVVKPDFRGQGLSAGHGVADSAYYSMNYNTDVMSLISSLKQTKDVDANNLNLWGHSMGAYIALRASVLSPDIKNTILLSGPVSSLKQMYLTYIPPSDENNPQALHTRQAVFSKYGTPGEDNDFWKNASPTNFLANTSTNYQIHVGALDPVVPPQLSADLDNDLTALKRTHEYYVYPNGVHNLVAQRSAIWSRSLAQLKAQ